jgi:alpha-L-rhamnosidase
MSWIRNLTATLLISGSLAAPRIAIGAGIEPTGLQCEFQSKPLALGERIPRLSWKLEATDAKARGLAQTAYRVLVASSAELLASDRADLWDSGRVASDLTSEIAYAGRPLASREACYWKVQVWDQAGSPSGWSKPSSWRMGLLDPADWRAQWIGYDAKPPAEGASLTDEARLRIGNLPWAQAPVAASKVGPLSVLVRRGFTLPADRKVARVTLTLTPDQWCSVTVNGQGVAEVARWDRMVPIDLTSAVVSGDNVVGLRITQEDGYPPAALGELEIAFAPSGLVRLPIDATWRFSGVAPDGWDTTSFSADKWAPLQIIADNKSPWGTPQNALLPLTPAPQLRKQFSLSKAVRRATLYATALGVYEMHLNGARIGRDIFTPGWTDYAHRVQYQTYDVTAQLRSGANVLAAELGDGWYAGLAGFTGLRHIFGGNTRFAAQLEIEFADGTRRTVATDGTWRAAFGPIRYADMLLGCAYDARLASKGWMQPGFDDSGWSPVATGLRAAGDNSPAPRQPIIEAASLEPVRVTDQLPAKSVTEPRAGVYVVDFGQNMVGWVRLKAAGFAGQKLTVRHGEMLNPDGTVYTSNLRGATATDVYWLSGNGVDTLEPFFTFHGFRYAEITGLASAPDPASFTGVVVGTLIRRTGDFGSSNPLLNQLYSNIIWSQRGNYLEAPTDCPQRDERLGWTGDTQFFIRTGAFNFDVESFIERWLVTIVTDEQGEEGTFPDVAPSIGRAPQAITAWGDAAIACTYSLWQVYGDTRVIERHFDALKRYIDWLQVSADRSILTVGGYGDWLNQGGGAKTEVIDTAYYANLCSMMAQMANAVGREADAAHFSSLRSDATAAFQKEFLLPDGKILDSSQTGFALAFTMNLLPDDLKSKAATQFVADIAAHNWHLATGFIGTPRLLPALHLAGRDDVAYRLLMQESFPSWLFPVKSGATTMWERWDGWTPEKGFQTIEMNSFNHYSFGAVGEYLYRYVAGIDTDGPGFRRIVFQPQPGGGLTEAHANYEAPTGRISSAWRIHDGKLSLDIAVPPNTTATVRVPSANPAGILESGIAAADSPGVKAIALGAAEADFEVGSGTYHFQGDFAEDLGDVVVVKATASKPYTQAKFATIVPRPETYVFFQGKYFDGLAHDPSISKAKFMDIARVLAPSLAKQNYLPTKNVKSADLLIVVNWGTTVTDQAWARTDLESQNLLRDEQQAVLTIKDGGPDAIGAISGLTFDLMQDRTKAADGQKFAESNAALLGYTGTDLRDEGSQRASGNGLDTESAGHLSDLDQDRYFVILLAYDYQEILRNAKSGDTHPKPVWSVRMNIRANGNNFTEALPAMSQFAADYFGKQSADLISAPVDVGMNARVEIGPVKVLDQFK